MSDQAISEGIPGTLTGAPNSQSSDSKCMRCGKDLTGQPYTSNSYKDKKLISCNPCAVPLYNEMKAAQEAEEATSPQEPTSLTWLNPVQFKAKCPVCHEERVFAKHSGLV